MANTQADYESKTELAQYLAFHFLPPSSYLPIGLAETLRPRSYFEQLLHFVTDSTEVGAFDSAIDIGCSVGGLSFALAESCKQVVGVDLSESFISAATELLSGETIEIELPKCGEVCENFSVSAKRLGEESELSFAVGSALELEAKNEEFDLACLINLIDRVPNPQQALAEAQRVVKPGGYILVATPLTWLESFTEKKSWIDRDVTGTMNAILDGATNVATADIPFCIREHERKFQLSLAYVSLWRKG